MSYIKGKHAIEEALSAGKRIERILVSFQAKSSPDVKQIVRYAKQNGVPVDFVHKNELSDLTQDSTHQSIVAKMPQFEVKDLGYLIAHQDKNPLVLAVDHIEDPFNFGAMIRTATSFGIKAIIFPKDRNSQITAGVVKASSGAIYHIDLIRVTNIAQACDQLQKSGYWIYTTDVNSGEPVSSAKVNTPTVLVVGNEHKGVSKRLQKISDGSLHIPMQGGFESLNVSVATGIFLYELSKNS